MVFACSCKLLDAYLLYVGDTEHLRTELDNCQSLCEWLGWSSTLPRGSCSTHWDSVGLWSSLPSAGQHQYCSDWWWWRQRCSCWSCSVTRPWELSALVPCGRHRQDTPLFSTAGWTSCSMMTISHARLYLSQGLAKPLNPYEILKTAAGINYIYYHIYDCKSFLFFTRAEVPLTTDHNRNMTDTAMLYKYCIWAGYYLHEPQRPCL